MFYCFLLLRDFGIQNLSSVDDFVFLLEVESNCLALKVPVCLHIVQRLDFSSYGAIITSCKTAAQMLLESTKPTKYAWEKWKVIKGDNILAETPAKVQCNGSFVWIPKRHFYVNTVSFKAFLTLLHWNHVCKSMTSQEPRLHIFNNSQSLSSSSTTLCSPSHCNIKQKGSKKTSHIALA